MYFAGQHGDDDVVDRWSNRPFAGIETEPWELRVKWDDETRPNVGSERTFQEKLQTFNSHFEEVDTWLADVVWDEVDEKRRQDEGNPLILDWNDPNMILPSQEELQRLLKEEEEQDAANQRQDPAKHQQQQKKNAARWACGNDEWYKCKHDRLLRAERKRRLKHWRKQDRVSYSKTSEAAVDCKSVEEDGDEEDDEDEDEEENDVEELRSRREPQLLRGIVHSVPALDLQLRCLRKQRHQNQNKSKLKQAQTSKAHPGTQKCALGAPMVMQKCALGPPMKCVGPGAQETGKAWSQRTLEWQRRGQEAAVPQHVCQLSATHGELVLIEYAEQSPVLTATFGMAAEMVTFYRTREYPNTDPTADAPPSRRGAAAAEAKAEATAAAAAAAGLLRVEKKESHANAVKRKIKEGINGIKPNQPLELSLPSARKVKLRRKEKEARERAANRTLHAEAEARAGHKRSTAPKSRNQLKEKSRTNTKTTLIHKSETKTDEATSQSKKKRKASLLSAAVLKKQKLPLPPASKSTPPASKSTPPAPKSTPPTSKSFTTPFGHSQKLNHKEQNKEQNKKEQNKVNEEAEEMEKDVAFVQQPSVFPVNGSVYRLGWKEESPFLGEVKPTRGTTALRNNLFLAPVFAHESAPTDFLLVRSATGEWVVRELPATVYLAGQLHPKVAVPVPGSKAAGRLLQACVRAAVSRAHALGCPAPLLMTELVEKFGPETEELVTKATRDHALICKLESKSSGSSSWARTARHRSAKASPATPRSTGANSTVSASMASLAHAWSAMSVVAQSWSAGHMGPRAMTPGLLKKFGSSAPDVLCVLESMQRFHRRVTCLFEEAHHLPLLAQLAPDLDFRSLRGLLQGLADGDRAWETQQKQQEKEAKEARAKWKPVPKPVLKPVLNPAPKVVPHPAPKVVLNPAPKPAQEVKANEVERKKEEQVKKGATQKVIPPPTPPAPNLILRHVLSYIERELQMAPWSQTRTFLDSSEGRFMMTLQGRGNPLGRGHGFAFLTTCALGAADKDKASATKEAKKSGAHTSRESKKKAKLEKQQQNPLASPKKHAVDPEKLKRKLLWDANETKPIIAAGEVTGTESDLRRLTMQQMLTQLEELGVGRDQVAPLSRWERVALIRRLANQKQLAEGHSELQKYARQLRSQCQRSLVNYQREKRQIFELQCQVLSCKDPPLPDQADKDCEEEDRIFLIAQRHYSEQAQSWNGGGLVGGPVRGPVRGHLPTQDATQVFQAFGLKITRTQFQPNCMIFREVQRVNESEALIQFLTAPMKGFKTGCKTPALLTEDAFPKPEPTFARMCTVCCSACGQMRSIRGPLHCCEKKEMNPEPKAASHSFAKPAQRTPTQSSASKGQTRPIGSRSGNSARKN